MKCEEYNWTPSPRAIVLINIDYIFLATQEAKRKGKKLVQISLKFKQASLNLKNAGCLGKTGLARLSLNWVWHSSAQACFIFMIKILYSNLGDITRPDNIYITKICSPCNIIKRDRNRFRVRVYICKTKQDSGRFREQLYCLLKFQDHKDLSSGQSQ